MTVGVLTCVFQKFRVGEEVLARWTDRRDYPAKIQSVNEEGWNHTHFHQDKNHTFVINIHVHVSEALFCALTAGTYTVQFYDGVVRCVKRIHIKSMPEGAKGQVRVTLQA